MTEKVTEMLEFLAENGVTVDKNNEFMMKNEQEQLNLLFKIFKEMVA
jgi:hypothetical protein